jgi:hypothetical protein
VLPQSDLKREMRPYCVRASANGLNLCFLL